MSQFIFSEYRKKNKKAQLGGYNVITQGKIYFLTDNGRIAKRHVGQRTLIGQKKVFPDQIKDKKAYNTIANDQHPGLLSNFQVDKDNYILYAQTGNLLQLGIPLEDMNQARIIFMQLCATVSHLHSNNIGHLDIKPQNIVLRDNGTVALIDFDGAQRLSNINSMTLTEIYSPPETVAFIEDKPGAQKYNPRAHDIWSIAMSLATILQPDIYIHSIKPHMGVINDTLFVNEAELNTGIKAVITEVKKNDPLMADLLSKLLDPDPDRRMEHFKHYQDHLLFAGLNSNAFDNRLIPDPTPPRANDKNYDTLKQYVRAIRKEIGTMKKRKADFSAQEKHRYTVLKHYRNEALLHMAQIEARHPDARQYTSSDRYNLEYSSIPTAQQWKRMTESTRNHAHEDIIGAYDAIEQFLINYQKHENIEQRASMVKELQGFLLESGFKDQVITDLGIKLDFHVQLNQLKQQVVAKKNMLITIDPQIVESCNSLLATTNHTKQQRLAKNIAARCDKMSQTVPSRQHQNIYRELGEVIAKWQHATRMPSPDLWAKMSYGHLFSIKGRTSKEIDKLVKQFHDSAQSQLDVAGQLIEKCHTYLQTHTNSDDRYAPTLNLLQRTQYFSQSARIPTFSEWQKFIPEELMFNTPDGIDEIEFLIMDFHEKDSDKNKLAIKIIRKCNQFLDENPNQSVFTENVNMLLQHSIYYLDNQHALKPDQELRESFSTKLGL